MDSGKILVGIRNIGELSLCEKPGTETEREKTEPWALWDCVSAVLDDFSSPCLRARLQRVTHSVTHPLNLQNEEPKPYFVQVDRPGVYTMMASHIPGPYFGNSRLLRELK